ncbi:MAG: FoF1 ATP synthase subunit gamma [Candidatus Brocadiia bacterium]|jgi:F-type H+-transporting ATPase subunit gamma|nr:FoF1 ATP synthase subunit gamma [Candidatus Brocadiia bacterium]
MAALRELQRKLESIKALREIVNAMRNLAAIYVRRAESAVKAIRPYTEVVETALGVVLDRCGIEGTEAEAEMEGDCMALVFASDQGLCGTYNDRVVRAALEFKDGTRGPVEFIAIGRRGGSLLALRGADPILTVSAPTSLEGIRSQVPELSADVFEAFLKRGAHEMVFIYNAYAGMGRSEETVRPVLPPRRDQLGAARGPQFRCEPILTASPDELLGDLAEEYFFIQLYRALLEGHASENGARLLAMTAASSNIDDSLAELTKDYQSARQDAITGELLDVVGGAEALREQV